MTNDFANLNKQVSQFCCNPRPLFLDESKALLKELLKAYYYENDFMNRNKLEQLLGMIRRSSETNVSTYAHILHSIAFEEHEAGDVDFSEYLFRSACDLVDDSSLNNNLAYVLRRKRDDSINNGEVITLLLPGVQEQEPFCMINMGLLFALNLSTQSDWRTADDLFSLLPDELSGAVSWWENLGKNNEPEGYLVHFFLLRYEKIERSSLGSIKGIVAHLTKNIKDFPEWLARDYSIKTLDDVFACVGIPDYYSILEDFIGKMPHSRESVDKLIEAISNWELWPVYQNLRAVLPSQVLPYPGELKPLYTKLLADFTDLLTSEELAILKADYKEKFSIPLPDEAE